MSTAFVGAACAPVGGGGGEGSLGGGWAAEVFSVTTERTFEHGSSTLQLRHDPRGRREVVSREEEAEVKPTHTGGATPEGSARPRREAHRRR